VRPYEGNTLKAPSLVFTYYSGRQEAQLSAHQRLQAQRHGGDGPVVTLRMSEINFKHAQWRLTEADGQLGIADVVLSNFLSVPVLASIRFFFCFYWAITFSMLWLTMKGLG